MLSVNAVIAKAIRYRYDNDTGFALNIADFTVQAGEFVAVLGHNGSGKSTLVKMLNMLLPLQEGELIVAGMDAADAKNVRDIRRKVGMVFQNPDSQFISSIVEEDVSFGLENYGIPRPKIKERVQYALKAVGMKGFEKHSPHMLSGGQKQRIAIAGVLAMDPDIIIFDESTAMLDPEGRNEVMDTIAYLNKTEGKTVILITHYIEEAVGADRIYIMKNGQMIAHGTTEDVLTDTQTLYEAGLAPTLPVRLYYDLKKSGITLDTCPVADEKLVEELCRLL